MELLYVLICINESVKVCARTLKQTEVLCMLLLIKSANNLHYRPINSTVCNLHKIRPNFYSVGTALTTVS